MGETIITAEWLTEIIKPAEGVTVSELTKTRIGTNQSILSEVYRVKLVWSGDDADLPKSVIVKLPSGKEWETERTSVDSSIPKWDPSILKEMHGRELKLYGIGKEIPVSIPKHYGSGDGETPFLVLSDHSELGIVQDLSVGLNVGQLLNLARSIGHLHAWSLKNSDLWSNLVTTRPKEYYTGFSSFAATCCRSLKAEFPDYFEPAIQPIEDFAASINYEDLSVGEQGPGKMGIPPVLVHGELTLENILFSKERNLGGTEIKVGPRIISILDWQNFHPGLPGEDFARLMYSSVPAPVRRKEIESVFRVYYKAFSDKYLEGKAGEEKKEETPPDLPFTMEQLKKSYRMAVPLAALRSFLHFFFAIQRERLANQLSDRLKSLLERTRDLCQDFRPPAS